jgi:hypothetical protein
MSDESDEDLKTHEMQELTEWKEFQPLAFCEDLEKVMASHPDQEGFAIALDRETCVQVIEVIRRGARIS